MTAIQIKELNSMNILTARQQNIIDFDIWMRDKLKNIHYADNEAMFLAFNKIE